MKRLVVGTLLLAGSMLANAAEFTLSDTRGQTHTLAKPSGRWVLLNLWATWCAACLTEMPELQALSQARKDLVVIGLAVDGQSPARIMQIARKLGVSYPLVAGNAAVAAPFAARGYPTSILYDPAGKQVWVKEGVLRRNELEDFFRRKRFD